MRASPVLLLWLMCAPGLADDTGLSQAELDRLAWQETDPRQEGSGVISLSGELALLDRQGATGRRRTGGGLNLAFITGRKSWPVMVGLNLGVMWLDYRSTRGPDVEGVFWDHATTVSRSLEMRHADLLVRYQPWWRWARPYLEGSFGVAGVWESRDWTQDGGDLLAYEETNRSVSYLTGASVGVDVPIFTLHDGAVNVFELVLSLGVRRLYTGPVKWSVATLSEGDDVPRISTVRERMRIWQPFLTLGISGASKPRPANAPFVPSR